MPWATHSQLLTLAHVSARDEKESTMMAHQCWSDPAYGRLVYNTIAFHSRYAAHSVYFHEFVYTAQATCVVLWQVYKMWNIPEEQWFAVEAGKPFAPMAFYNQAIQRRMFHSDQRVVLQALATITAWHKEPFDTSIMLETTVIPPVLLLFPHVLIQHLLPYAQMYTDKVAERIRVFAGCQFYTTDGYYTTDTYLQHVFGQAMDYSMIDQTMCAPAYNELVTAAGITSLFGTPTQQQWYNVHNSVLMMYNKLARPLKEEEQRYGPTACCMKLVSEDINVMDMTNASVKPNSTQRQHYFLTALKTIMSSFHSFVRSHYSKVDDLGKYDAGQFVRTAPAPRILRCMRVASPVFFR